MKGKSEHKKPGVIIYFDIRTGFELLDMEERGELFTAILNYAEYGELPELEKFPLLCFNMLRPRIDYDEVKYGLTIAQRKYAVYVREKRKHQEEPIPYDEWLDQTDIE